MEYTGMCHYYVRKHREGSGNTGITSTRRLYNLLLSQHYDKETVDGLIEYHGYCRHCLNKHDTGHECSPQTHNDETLEQHLRDTLRELKWG